MGIIRDIKTWIREERKRIESLLKETLVIVVLLGAGRKEIEKRRDIAKKLEQNGIVALIPEDDFAPDVAPSLVEEAVFKEADVDLIFVNVESWGSATEFAQFYDNAITASKLRVLTHYKFHPIYGSSQSYLTDLYLSFTAKYGHVYAYDDKGNFPDPEKIILTLSIRYKFLKALGKV
ncbi:hypothetical protein H5T51_09090 [Candidatus Bathyarchaeota archaeon]|nr:hypothetical protein [Candidatus Bathyarchaeota archaeon]